MLGYAKEGEFFGDMEYVTKTTRSATYTTISKCNLIIISHASLSDAILNNYNAGVQFKQMVRDHIDKFRLLQRQPELKQTIR